MEQVLDLYRKTFQDLGIKVLDSGKLETIGGNNVTIDGKDVVLPLEEYLIENKWEDIYPWHPLSENNILGPSITIRKYTAFLKVTTHLYLVEIINTLIQMVQNPELQNKIKGTRLIRILSELPKVSIKQIDDVRKGVNRYLIYLSKNPVSPITIKLSRIKGGKTEDGIRATRKATVITNYCEVDDPASYHGHCNSMSIAAKEFMDQLFNVTNISCIEFGDGVAPYYQAILKVHKYMVEYLRPLMEEIASIKSITNVPKGEWFDAIEDMKLLSTLIVSLPGNEGIPIEETLVPSIESPGLYEGYNTDSQRNRPVAREIVDTLNDRPLKPVPVVQTRFKATDMDSSEPTRDTIDLDMLDRVRWMDNNNRTEDSRYGRGGFNRKRPVDKYVDDVHEDYSRGRARSDDDYYRRQREEEYYREEEDRHYNREREHRRRDEQYDQYQDDRNHRHRGSRDYAYQDDRNDRGYDKYFTSDNVTRRGTGTIRPDEDSRGGRGGRVGRGGRGGR